MSIKSFSQKMLMLTKLKGGQPLKERYLSSMPLSGSEDYSNLVLQTPIMYIPFSPGKIK